MDIMANLPSRNRVFIKLETARKAMSTCSTPVAKKRIEEILRVLQHDCALKASILETVDLFLRG